MKHDNKLELELERAVTADFPALFEITLTQAEPVEAPRRDDVPPIL
jgi:hypothetical protein